MAWNDEIHKGEGEREKRLSCDSQAVAQSNVCLNGYASVRYYMWAGRWTMTQERNHAHNMPVGKNLAERMNGGVGIKGWKSMDAYKEVLWNEKCHLLNSWKVWVDLPAFFPPFIFVQTHFGWTSADKCQTKAAGKFWRSKIVQDASASLSWMKASGCLKTELQRCCGKWPELATQSRVFYLFVCVGVCVRMCVCPCIDES